MLCYPKRKNDLVYIYEIGTRYEGMRLVKSHRMFKDLNNEPLTFPNIKDARDWCFTRNQIMRI